MSVTHNVKTTFTSESVEAECVREDSSTITVEMYDPSQTRTLFDGDEIALLTADHVIYNGVIEEVPGNTEDQRTILVTLW